MKSEFENIPLYKNENKHRFEIEINGYFAFIDYKESQNAISLIHTEAETELAGTGAAAAVVKKNTKLHPGKRKETLTLLSVCFCIHQKTS